MESSPKVKEIMGSKQEEFAIKMQIFCSEGAFGHYIPQGNALIGTRNAPGNDKDLVLSAQAVLLEGFHEKEEGFKIVLNLMFSDQIEFGDMLVNPWVLDMAGLNHGESRDVQIIQLGMC